MDSNYFSHHDPINHSDVLDKAFGHDSNQSHHPVFVEDYNRSDGTHVKAHMRSHPDGNPFNNYTYPGHINPFTGEVATGDPLSYLSHHDSSFHHVLQQSNPLAHIQDYSLPQLTFD
ncbi:hypothetical protein [Paenibacillus wynnii]|uniref:hypothetical protein n=1 Tax=Paenibacillus wynnii TaxID=268407 RepID=UPI00278CCCF0|nr:hypothetical protein [Paenibacillus wynnii]MDQ0193539.1 hypothetical protein [Paenibacillus wynnii]